MNRHPFVPYVAPFAVFLAFVASERFLPLDAGVLYPLRATVVTAVLATLSRDLIDLRFRDTASACLLGVAVFAVWIAPDVLWPAYRTHWLFHNSIVGEIHTPPAASVKTNSLFILFRVYGCTLVVPVLEEIFWRGWLARWLIDSRDFRRVPLGAFTASSFALSTVLFASEHGPYWDVGLIAGAAYNWWMHRTGSINSCIVAHTVTNGCLSAYVLSTDRWQYWL